jgi:hypothetical protein
LPLDEISEDDQKPVMELITSRTFIESHHNPTTFNKDALTMYRNDTPLFVRKIQRSLASSIENLGHVSISVDPVVKRNIVDYLVRLTPDERLCFDALGDPRLGGVSYEGIDAMYRTHQIYMTRSSPKAIEMHIKNLRLSDLHVIAWYFNMMQRLEKFNLIPLDATMVSRQAAAKRRYQFTLLDDEPLPPTAFTVHVCVCCLRVTTFHDQPIYGNDQVLSLRRNVTLSLSLIFFSS